MLLLEHAEKGAKSFDIKVFATDAAQAALSRARTGLFPGTIAETMPADKLGRFFDKEDDLYRAKKGLRESVIFAPQNLLADPPFSRLDLVTCRNLLIYLEPEVQDRVIALLHFSLREGGHLFLGTAETVGRHTDLFDPISKKWRIYRRVGSTRHELVDFPLLGGEHHGRHPGSGPGLQRAPAEEAREALLATFAPAAVLTDERARILYFHGDLEQFLTPPSGEPTLDLLRMARDEFRPKLRAAIRRATKEKMPISAEVILRTRSEGTVRLMVSPVSLRSSAPRFLVSFEKMVPGQGDSDGGEPPVPQAVSDGVLEDELRSAREELRLSVEQLETSNEELKASNEEITSMNEELQSTNEELETSKEELQSLNEELNTVNTQLQSKVEELEDRTNDLNNLLNSTDVATLFLDNRFRIRWFSPPMRQLFQIIQADVGRPIADFAQRFEDLSFLDDAEEVLRSLQPRDREVAGADRRWHLRRILPYRTDDNCIDGVVATFTDITERKHWEQALAAAKAYAEQIVDTTRQPLIVLDDKFVVQSANRAFYDCFKLTPEKAEGRILFEISNGDWGMPELRDALRDSTPDGGIVNDLEVVHTFRSLGTRRLLVNVRRLDDAALMLVAIEDVTERKHAEEHREALLAELQNRVKNLLTEVQAVISHSRAEADSVESYAESLDRRISAIARTQDIIGGRTSGISLRELVESEVASVATGNDIGIEGPEVSLSSNVAQSFALALHELAANAVEYGALSNNGGTLEIEWGESETASERAVNFRWIESGIHVEDPQGLDGFGSKLIKEVVPRLLGGSAELIVAPTQIACMLSFPTGPGAEVV